jgi:hypothetical protein
MNPKPIIPSSWNQVSLEQGKQIFLIDQTIISGQSLIETVYEVLTGNEYDSISIGEVSQVDDQIKSLLNSKFDSTLKHQFLIKDQVFYLMYDLTGSVGRQWRDWEMQIKENPSGNLWNVIEKILPIIILPAEQPVKKITYHKSKKDKNDIVNVLDIKLEKYSAYNNPEREKLFLEHMSIADVYPIALFFWLAGIKFINTLITSLSPQQPTLNM